MITRRGKGRVCRISPKKIIFAASAERWRRRSAAEHRFPAACVWCCPLLLPNIFSPTPLPLPVLACSAFGDAGLQGRAEGMWGGRWAAPFRARGEGEGRGHGSRVLGMRWLVHMSLREGPSWCELQVHCAKQLRAVKVKASINRPAKPQTQNRKISIFLLIWSFNNNIFKKNRKSEIHQVPARELGFCGECVYGGGRDGVVQTGKEGPWLEGFFSSLVSKEGEGILSS